MMKMTSKEFCLLKKSDLLGKIVVFPTDTVYGVGSLYDDTAGIQKIYQMKGRDFNKPLAVLIHQISDLDILNCELSPKIIQMMKKHWPGALTIILNSDNETIGVRIPDSEFALSILQHFGPMKVTSVNISGQPSLNNIDDIEKIFQNQIDYLIIDQVIFSSHASTVVDATSDEWKILRQGVISLEDLID